MSSGRNASWYSFPFRYESFSFDAFQWSVGDGPLFVHKCPGPQWQSMTLWPEDLKALLGSTSIDLVEDDDNDEETRDRRVAAKLLALGELQDSPRAASGVGAGGATNRAGRAAATTRSSKFM